MFSENIRNVQMIYEMFQMFSQNISNLLMTLSLKKEQKFERFQCELVVKVCRDFLVFTYSGTHLYVHI